MTNRRAFCAAALPATLGLGRLGTAGLGSLAGTAGLMAALPPRPALAQEWPTKPIRMIVPYTPGGYTDNMARLVGEALSHSLGQPVVYDNKPGANSLIGAGMAASAPADGYTLVTVIAAHAANPSLYAKMPFDAIESFAPVTLISIAPLLMAANIDAPFNTVQELIAYAKKNPGKLSFGSSGQGSAAHLSTEYFCLQSGTKMVHIPYKGTAPALTDLMGGQIDVMFDTVSAFAQHVTARKVKAIGVASDQRIRVITDVPTFIEQGMPGFLASTWAMLLAPKGTPAPIIDRLQGQAATAIHSADFTARLDAMGILPAGMKPAETASYLKAEVKKWREVIEKAGVKIEQ